MPIQAPSNNVEAARMYCMVFAAAAAQVPPPLQQAGHSETGALEKKLQGLDAGTHDRAGGANFACQTRKLIAHRWVG